MNTLYQKIIDTPLPAFRANIRHLTRKEWAQNVRSLLKSLDLKFVSVTAPNYSMAQSIRISFHQPDGENDGTARAWENSEHGKIHAAIDEQEREAGEWFGYAQHCPHCKQRGQASARLTAIILAAFPDLDDRSDTQSDYFDYCLSIE